MPDPRHVLGHRAEMATARWLTSHGWQVLARRWRDRAGELDLVCRDPDGWLVAVEVKLRRSGRAGSALEAVDHRRLARMRAALAAYARDSGRGWPALRLDLVTLEPAAGGWRLQHRRGVGGW